MGEASGVGASQRRYEGEEETETEGIMPLSLKKEGEAMSDA